MKTLLVAINSKYIHTALGMHSIYNYCKNKKIELDFCEETIQTPMLAALSEITGCRPDLIGINVHIWNKNYVLELAGLIRQVLPQVKIVLGGPEVAFTAKDSFEECLDVDYIIQGEGEEVFAELVESLQKGKKLPKYVAYRDLAGKVQNISQPTIVEDLSVLPFPYEDLAKVVAEHKITYYECTRGCPFSCSYCLSGISHNVRQRPIGVVIADLDKFIEAKVPLVKFVDRTYNLEESYFLPIMEHLAKARTETTFHFELKADLLSEKALAFLKTVPKDRFQLEIGVQTTNTKTLAAIGRHDYWDKLAYNVKQILNCGNMHVHLDLIAGLPYEDLASFKKSFNDVYDLQANMLQLGFLKVLKGALIGLQKTEHAMLYMAQPPYEILQTKYLSYEELRFLKILEDVFDHTYNTGKYVHTLNYLIAYGYKKDAFAFYEALTKWWEAKGLYPLGHNVKDVALLLLKFVQEKHVDLVLVVEEILRFDIFVGQPNWRPEELQWHTEELREPIRDFWRNLDLVHQYLPEYEFSTWRKLRKYLPIESFMWTPETQYGEKHFVMADYTGKEISYMEIEL
ncbi:MAG: DUF4080 domain-containing protein [Acidaminococcaceae bacterium]|nr:DUF4080 domain-containing protein [Acidaminococcaceae bacterium]